MDESYESFEENDQLSIKRENNIAREVEVSGTRRGGKKSSQEF